MDRIAYYPDVENLIHMAENFNVNIGISYGVICMYPTTELGIVECTLLDVSMKMNSSWSILDWEIWEKWVQKFEKEPWMYHNVLDEQIITFHND